MLDNLESIEKAAKAAMANGVTAFKKQLEKLHTGRASPALLENIQVTETHGGTTRLAYIASITAIDARTLKITPFDPLQITAIGKGLQKSELSINPDIRKTEILISLPPLTAERRKETGRLIQKMTEEMCEEIRNHRRHANTQCKQLVKGKSISEDEEHRSHKKIQQLTDTHIAEIKKLAQDKEKQVMAV